MEAAASLFGSDDGASDLFASFGTEQSASHSGNDLFGAHEPTDGTSHFPPESTQPPTTEHQTFTGGGSSFYDADPQDAYSAVNAVETRHAEPAPVDMLTAQAAAATQPNVYETYAPRTTTPANSASDVTHAPAAYERRHTPGAETTPQHHTSVYDTYAPQHTPAVHGAYATPTNAYTPPQVYTPTHSSVHGSSHVPTAAAYDPYSPYVPASQNRSVPQALHPSVPAATSSYDPYAPLAPAKMSSAPQPSVYSPPVPAGASPYDPYAPSATQQRTVSQTNSSPYAPVNGSPIAAATSPYNPYAPLAAVTHSRVAPPARTTTHASTVQNQHGTVPRPPAAAPAIINRPKTSNAYDPPFPTTKSARRVSGTRLNNTGPTPSSHYTAYGPLSPSLPAPPPHRQPSMTGGSTPAYVNHFQSPPAPMGAVTRQKMSGSPLALPPRTPSAQGSQQPQKHYFESHSQSTAEPSTPDFISMAGDPEAIQEEVLDQAEDGMATVAPLTFNTPSAVADNASSDIPAEQDNDFLKHSHTAEDSEIESPISARKSPYDLPPPSRVSSRASSARTTPPASGTVSAYNLPSSSHYDAATVGGTTSRTSSRASGRGTDTYSNGYNLYQPVERVRSPPSASSNGYDPVSEKVTSPLPNGYQPTPYDPYAPQTNGHAINRVPSSGSLSITSPKQYVKPPPKAAPRMRSMSNSSQLSSASANEDVYSPPARGHETDYGSFSSSRFNYPNILEVAVPGPEPSVHNPTIAPYVPSPSLMGSNDPLGRTAARVPIFSFGFGGKFVSCFHGASALETGFDVALSSRKSTGIHIRVLNAIIPDSALGLSADAFPGPLMSDPGSPGGGLMRTGAAQTKAKKAKLFKYIDERVEQISLGIGYLNEGSVEQRQADGKLVLIRLLRVMLENDGRLSGTPLIDRAVRAAVIPRFAVENFGPGTDTSAGVTSSSFSPADNLASYTSLSTLTTMDTNETPISVTTLLPSTLEKIQELILRGERKQAYHLALDQKLWAHAMVIASSIDRDAWKEVVNEFLKGELGVQTSSNRLQGSDANIVNGREGLRVAYSLFSGQGAASVQEMIPQNLLARGAGASLLQLPAFSHSLGTPMTPGFPALSHAPIPVQSLSKWAETVAMMYSSPLTTESSTAITALGDQLMASQWTEAAHVCYLLAPQTSPLGGLGNTSARIVLLGSRSPQVMSNFHTDPDSIILTEILEYALSLTPITKGQEPFGGLSYLQPYRLIRATSLAEVGYVQLATRYCDAITASSNRPSPYFNYVFTEHLKGLTDRIVAAPHLDKSGSWIGGKMTKPSLDTIGDWLGGRITKLITGDGDSTNLPEEESTMKEEHTFSGPFGQYSTISTISSTAPSTSSSPQPPLHVLPPRRTGSAVDHSSSPPLNSSYAPVDRASSAMDYVRRKPSPAPRVVSARPSMTTFAQAQAPSYGLALDTHNAYSPSVDALTPRPSNNTTEEEDSGQDAWWGGSSYGDTSSTQTPTAANFLRVDEHITGEPSSDGFISLMDAQSYTVTARTQSQLSQSQAAEQDDEEDLGFGNSKRDNATTTITDSRKEPAPAVEKAQTAPPPEPKQAPSGWFGRLWKKNDSAPGPIKASLGEEQSFYYDKDLKRWVNKKAGSGEVAKPSTPPPPPSRAQTASPGSSGPPPHSPGPTHPPPARAASAMNLSSGPPPPGKAPMRVRSNLVPDSAGTESAPGTPTGFNSLAPPGPPPGGRPKSQAGKRNIRSRYVDVLREEGK